MGRRIGWGAKLVTTILDRRSNSERAMKAFIRNGPNRLRLPMDKTISESFEKVGVRKRIWL
eukprot:1181268-Amphidinium_carterae.1